MTTTASNLAHHAQNGALAPDSVARLRLEIADAPRRVIALACGGFDAFLNAMGEVEKCIP